MELTRPCDKRPSVKIYDFLARSTSRSRSKSTRRSSDSATPDDPDTTLTTMDSIRSKPVTRSPSRPLSNNRPLSDQTARTHSTITPLPASSRAHTPRTTADGYDMSMPPPPVPTPTSSKRKSKPPTLFGISLSGRSRPTTPKDERADPISPPGTPARGRPGFSSSSRKDKTSVMPGALVLGNFRALQHAETPSQGRPPSHYTHHNLDQRLSSGLQSTSIRVHDHPRRRTMTGRHHLLSPPAAAVRLSSACESSTVLPRAAGPTAVARALAEQIARAISKARLPPRQELAFRSLICDKRRAIRVRPRLG